MSKSRAEILDKLKALIAESLDVEKATITEGSAFIDDLGADSLDIVELVMQLEKEFGIEIPDEEAEKIQTVANAVDHIHSALSSS